MLQNNIRLRKPNEVVPTYKEGQSFYQFVEEYNGGKVELYGFIGRDGEKIHKFIATYIQYKNENIIVSIQSSCGSQSYKSHLGSDLTLSKEHINCKKCNK
jgi:hypothetical protein